MTAKFEAIVAGKHDVKHDQIRLKKFEARQRAVLTPEDARLKTGAGQVVLDESREFGFVFYDGYSSRHKESAGRRIIWKSLRICIHRRGRRGADNPMSICRKNGRRSMLYGERSCRIAQSNSF